MAAPPVVIAAGSATDIGTAHGEGLRAQIHDHLTRWKQALERAHGVDADRLIAGFVAAGGFRAAVERYTPWLIDEIDGIATGADLSNAEAWFLQLMDESWQQQSLFRREHCTAFGVVDGMRSWSGQTMDLEPFRHGAQAVLDIHPDGQRRQQIVTMAGSIGLLGVSSAGFSVCVNALEQVPTRPDGLPVLCMIRGALAQENAADAEAFIRNTPHATGQSYTITGTRTVVTLECSAVGVVESMTGERKRWHTNHPLVGYVPEESDHESERRGEAARAALLADGFTRSRAQSLLCHAPIHRPLPESDAPTSLFTFASALFELRDGTDPVMRLRVPGDAGETGDTDTDDRERGWREYTMPRVRVIDRRQNPATTTPP